MTYDCCDVLPPYAAYLVFAEKQNLVNFQKAVRPLGGPTSAPFSPDILNNEDVSKWAYAVAITRSIEINGERFVAPMIDMINHGDPNVEVSFDGSDCYAYSSVDIPAGSPLLRLYGDPTDPTPLLANYGFLDETSSGVFCKLMNMITEMEELGEFQCCAQKHFYLQK